MQLIYSSRDPRRADALAQLLSQARVPSLLDPAPTREPERTGPEGVGVWVAGTHVETARNVMRDHGYRLAGAAPAWRHAAWLALGALALAAGLAFGLGGP